jgi:MFS family permease
MTVEREDTYAAEIARNLRWNFFANAADLTSVNLAKAFVFHATVLTLYTSHLTDSSVLIGLVPAVLQVGFLLPQIFMARQAEAMERKKPFVVKISIFERVPYFVIAISIFLAPQLPNWVAYGILLLNIAVASGAGGLATPAWKAMLGKVIHPDRRGSLFAVGMSLGGFLGIGGSLLTRHILATYSFPLSYGLCFLFAFAGQALSWAFLTLNREPPRAQDVRSATPQEYLGELPTILRGNRDFLMYLISQTLIVLGTMGVTFYILYGKETLGIGGAFAGQLTMVALVSQSAGTPILGWVSDRLGHKRSAVLAALLGAAALVIMLFLRSTAWLYPVFICMNLCIAGLAISRHGITMEFCGADRLPTYTAISGTLIGIPTLLAPIVGGWFIELIGYRGMFIVALVLTITGVMLTVFGYADPRVRSLRTRGRQAGAAADVSNQAG